MKIFLMVTITLLSLLALTSGVTKVALMQQDLEFFGRHGFSEAMLVAFGLAQILGAVLMSLGRTRIVGTTIVTLTFAVSLALLILDHNIAMSVITGIALVLLLVVLWSSVRARKGAVVAE